MLLCLPVAIVSGDSQEPSMPIVRVVIKLVSGRGEFDISDPGNSSGGRQSCCPPTTDDRSERLMNKLTGESSKGSVSQAPNALGHAPVPIASLNVVPQSLDIHISGMSSIGS